MSTIIHKTAFIGPNVKIGKNVKIYPYAVIGTRAEHKGFMDKPLGEVVIGDNCVIREFCTINAGTTETTTLEDNVWMLRGSHVGHDAYIEHDVTLSCNVIIGGHSRIFQHSNLGIGSVVHQRCVVPSYTMLGMNSTWTKKTNPYPGMVFVGSPAKSIKRNIKLLDDLKLAPINLDIEKRRVMQFLMRERNKCKKP